MRRSGILCFTLVVGVSILSVSAQAQSIEDAACARSGFERRGAGCGTACFESDHESEPGVAVERPRRSEEFSE